MVKIITGNDNIYLIIIIALSAADRLTRRPERNRYNIIYYFCIISCYYSILGILLPVSRVYNNGTATADAVVPHPSCTILINRLFSESVYLHNNIFTAD